MYSIRNSKYTFFYIHFHYKPDRQAGQMTGPRVGGGWDIGSACHELNLVGGGGLCAGPNQGAWGVGNPPPRHSWLAG